jgi:L-asparaginase
MVDAARSAGADGIVAVLLGAGHAPPAFLAACRAAAAEIPVVACVRPESGRILRGTYGFDGAERDVRAAGLILAPSLSPAAARITLMACLGAGHSRVATAAVFAPSDP